MAFKTFYVGREDEFKEGSIDTDIVLKKIEQEEHIETFITHKIRFKYVCKKRKNLVNGRITEFH